VKLEKALRLRKAKYIKRWKGKDRKWHYQYEDEKSKKRVIVSKPEKGKEPWRTHSVKSRIFLNANKAGFNINPDMVGHYSARKALYETENKLGKYMSDLRTKALIQNSLNVDAKEWNYFVMHLTQKEVSLIAHTAHYLNKQTPLELLQYINQRSGMLKTDLSRLLEYAAYKSNRKDFIEYSSRNYTWLGMSKEDAKKRSIKYSEGLKSRYHKVYTKIWGK